MSAFWFEPTKPLPPHPLSDHQALIVQMVAAIANLPPSGVPRYVYPSRWWMENIYPHCVWSSRYEDEGIPNWVPVWCYRLWRRFVPFGGRP